MLCALYLFLACFHGGEIGVNSCELRLERNEQAVSVLLDRLLDGARSIKGKRFGGTTS